MRINIVKAPAVALRRFDPADGARLLTSAHAAASRDAERIIETAQREAHRLIAAAKSDATRIAIEARAIADREGALAWNDAALELSRARVETVATVEHEAISLAFEIARRIVGDAVAASAETWAELVARSTDRLRRDAKLTVRHATVDAGRVHAVRERLSAFAEVAFEPDETLEAGDCVAECAGVRVDARLDVQLAAIERLLRESPRAEVNS